MNTQFKKGILELCILKLINKNDLSGYQLLEELSQYLEVSVNTVYPILRRLTNDGVLETYENYDNNRKRKIYTFSKLGLDFYQKLYEEWKKFNSNVERLLLRED